MKKYLLTFLLIALFFTSAITFNCTGHTNTSNVYPTEDDSCLNFPEVTGEDGMLNGYVLQGNPHNYVIESKKLVARGGRGKRYYWSLNGSSQFPPGVTVNADNIFLWNENLNDSLVPGIYLFSMVVLDSRYSTQHSPYDLDTVQMSFTVTEVTNLECALFQQPIYEINLGQVSHNTCFLADFQVTAGCSGPQYPISNLKLPHYYLLAGGTFPNGCTLNPEGTLWGRPQGGTYYFRVSVLNSEGEHADCNNTACPEYRLYVSY